MDAIKMVGLIFVLAVVAVGIRQFAHWRLSLNEGHDNWAPEAEEGQFKDLMDYLAAHHSRDRETCTAIERRYDLEGYPADLVTDALRAIARGDDVNEVINEYHMDKVC